MILPLEILANVRRYRWTKYLTKKKNRIVGVDIAPKKYHRRHHHHLATVRVDRITIALDLLKVSLLKGISKLNSYNTRRVSYFEKRTEWEMFFEQMVVQEKEIVGNTVGFVQNGRHATRRRS